MTGAGVDPWLALGMGLLGGFGHCAAMCGPLVAAVVLSAGPRPGLRPAALLQLEYHAGRITTYGFAGAVMGAAGSAVGVAARVAGFQDAVSVIAGALMAAMGLGAAGVLPAAKRIEGRLAGRVFDGVQRLVGGAPGRGYPLGLALGFLPCGLSWAAFLGSAATGGPVRGAIFAIAFGLGTVPALLLVGGAAALFSARARGSAARLGGVAAALVGLIFVLRGLHLHAL